jgi:hypothetical protein
MDIPHWAPDVEDSGYVNENLNSYLVLFRSGLSQEIQAQYYERVLDEWVFIASGEDVARIAADTVASISKAR